MVPLPLQDLPFERVADFRISLYNENVGSPVYVKFFFQKQFPAGAS